MFVGAGVYSNRDSDDGTGGGAAAPAEEREDPEKAPAFSAEELVELPTTRWITNGGNIWNQRYSPLDEIDTENVDELGGVWRTRLESGIEAKYSGEAQILFYGGKLYVVTGADDVFALDVETGEKLWTYEAGLDQKISTVCCGWTSRGVGLGEGLVFVGQLDGKLVALDQGTGEVAWETQVADWQKGYTITMAPLYYDGKVAVGVSGGEYGIRGHVTTYDAKTGEQVWRFYTIPAPGELGHDTWPAQGDAWRRGGASVWQTPAVDPELGLMYFSTSNAAPDFNGSTRAGDNLFAASIVAVDAATGEYRWHFQEVHHDIWDYDAPSPIVLFDIELDGEERQALAQPGKTGWVYILDRTNGEPLIGIEERPVPQEPRQKTAHTQPFPLGDSFVPQSVDEDQVPKDAVYRNGGRIFTPYWRENAVWKPAALGGANWPPSSFNPDTGYLYVCALDRLNVAVASEEEYVAGEQYLGSTVDFPQGFPVRGTVTAMDMTTNTVAWQREWNDACYSGTVTTAGGLVFVGHNDGNLLAYDAESGDEAWSFQTGAGMNSTVTIFEWQGTQHIAAYSAGNALAGSPHGDSVWLVSLEGQMGPADTAGEDGEGVDHYEGQEGEELPEGDAAAGEELYANNCAACHGLQGEGGRAGPALRGRQSAANEAAVFEQILNGGGGMPSFEGTLTPEQIADVTAYVVERIVPRSGR